MMRKLLLLALIASGAMLVATEALATSTATTGETKAGGINIELGKRDFYNYCAACHGVDARGDGTVAEFLTLRAADLTRLKKLNAGLYPRERVTRVIDGRAEVKVHGARDMPVWGDWFDEEANSPATDAQARDDIVRDRIESLVSYIETLQVN